MPNQDVAVELFYDGAWHNIVPDDDVFADTPITITRGQGDQGAAPRPASMSMRLANDDDMYRTSNPMSPLYGKAGRNTPLRTSVGDTVRASVEASSWQAGQSRDFRRTPRRGKAWVDLDGGGLMQRINEWTKPPQSAMQRYLNLRGDLIDYWPGYDPGSSTRIISDNGGTPAQAEDGFKLDATFGNDDAPAGSAASFKVGDESALVAPFRTVPTAGQWTMGIAFRLTKTINPANPGQPIFLAEMPDLWSAVMYVNSTDYNLAVDSPSFPFAFDESVTYDQGDGPYQWVLMLVSLSNSGGTTSVKWSWYPQNGSVRTVTNTFASTALNPLDWRINVNTNIAQTQFAEIFMVSSGAVSIDSDMQAAFDGHVRELAAIRFARLMDEENIAYYISAGFGSSMPMGPQRSDTLANLLIETVRTDDALMFDYLDEARLYFLCRADRYNQTPALQLAPTDLPSLPTEVTDNLGVYNVVIASQRNGGDYTARDDTGPLGTQSPPDGVGEKRGTVDINVVDEAILPQVANWWLRLGTVNQPRYPRVVVNLAALDADMVAQVEDVDVGSVITIDGFREDLIRLYVLGYTETISWPRARSIVFTCAPDQPYDVAVQDDTGKRQESYTSTLNVGYSATATTMVVMFSVLSDQWSTVNTPYDWVVSGERIRVTAMGAVTGPGPWTQSATVTRAVNGVSKDQVSGEPVHMHPEQQARQAL